MALKATATRSIRLSVSQSIGLKQPYVLTGTPSKPNLIYSVGVLKTVEETFRPLADRLQHQRCEFPKTMSMDSHWECVLIFTYSLKNTSNQPVQSLKMHQTFPNS